MKFYILVKNKEFGDIKSETFESDEKEYKKMINELFVNGDPVKKLDFYNDKGDFIVIPEGVLQKSIIYVKKV
jgi:hypothetical protein